MGLFKKKDYVAYAASSGLFEEDWYSNTTLTQIMTGIREGDSLGERATVASLIGLPGKARQMLYYARKYYVHGTPTGDHKFFEYDQVSVETAIRNSIGGAIDTLIWSDEESDSQAFLQHTMESRLQREYQKTTYFNWDRNLGIPSTNWDRSLTEVEIPVIDPATPSQYVKVPNTPTLVWNAATRKFSVLFKYTDSTGNKTFQVPYSFSPRENPDGALIARYTRPKDPKTYYWQYFNDGSQGNLEGTWHNAKKQDIYNEFLPIAILMHDQEDYNEDENSQLAITTNKLLKKLELEGDPVLEAIHDEDLGRIQKWDTFVQFATPIRAKTEGGKRYLYHFFSLLDQDTHYSSADFADYIGTSGDGRKQPMESFIITEGGDGGYHSEIRWSFIEKTPTTVTTHLPDGFKAGQTHVHYVQRVKGGTSEYAAAIKEFYPNIDHVQRRNQTNENDFIIITRHLTDAECRKHNIPVNEAVQQLGVMGLSMRNKINTRDYTTKKNPRDRYYLATMFGDDEENSEFVLPVNAGVMYQMPPMQQEEMLCEAFRVTLFCVRKQSNYKKWFKWVTVIVTIIIVILAYYFLAFIGEAIRVAGTAVIAALWAAAYLTVTLAISMIVTFATGMIGSEWGRWLFMAAVFYVGYTQGLTLNFKDASRAYFSNITSAWSNLSTAPSLWEALKFINSVSMLTNIGYSVYERQVLKDLARDYERLEQDYKDEMEAIEAAWAGLTDAPDWLDPLDLISQPNGMGIMEDADGFYARLLNPQPGLMALDFPVVFNELALAIPDNGQQTSITMEQYNDFFTSRGA